MADALALVHNGETFVRSLRPNQGFDLPGKRRVAAAVKGWGSGDGYSIVAPAAADPVPDGQRSTGITAQKQADGAWKWAHALEQAPPSPVPPQVDLARAKIALDEAGLLDDVEAALAAITDPTTKRRALIAWDASPTISRNGQLVTTLAATVPGLADRLDDLFRTAAAIEL